MNLCRSGYNIIGFTFTFPDHRCKLFDLGNCFHDFILHARVILVIVGGY